MAVCYLCGTEVIVSEEAHVKGCDLHLDCARLISRRLIRRGNMCLNRRDRLILKRIRKNSQE